ncbi:UbiA prenyltransferase family-domain-containing protein [Mycena floridula]|nr:UbiA prenyltransferase family-domain-containing protein [Mycena floridula]
MTPHLLTIVEHANLVFYHSKTMYLFIRSDIKTILIPVTSFAYIVAPEFQGALRWSAVPFWVALHLLLIDIDNQAMTEKEDRANKPWRPVPSGRICASRAKIMAQALFVLCPAISLIFGGRALFLPSFCFSFLVHIYDHRGAADHWFWKNLVNASGYMCLEFGATRIIAQSGTTDQREVLAALAMSGGIILTTVHVQDFQDEPGDRLSGRQTVCIRWGQSISRFASLVVIMLWSWIVPGLWGSSTSLKFFYGVLGSFVGGRFYLLRSVLQDEASYRAFNVWLVAMHMLALKSKSVLG